MNQSKKAIIFGLASMIAITLGSCGGTSAETYVTGDYLTGKGAKLTYNAYISSAPTTLSSLTSQSATDVQHIANFSDTLLMNDSYGILRKSLASEAYRNEANDEFWFKVRDDVAWRTSTGAIYTARNSAGVTTEQYVTADDFVTAAELILDYTNNSEIYYMYTLFIENAWEYYCYTMMASYIASSARVGGVDYGALKGDYDAQATQLAVLIEEYSGEAPTTPITGEDITSISRFERVGVKVDDEGYLRYTLKQSATFFPTVLTYAPYMPVNRSFYNTTRSTYGNGRNDILYIGPYFLSDMDTNHMTYTKNPYYHDADNVHVETINYRVADANLSYADMRAAFDQGTVDGFTLNQQDADGWKMYITGPDGTGTIQNPYSGSVNSREIDSIDYTFHYVLNVNRPIDEGVEDNETVASIQNTNKALGISEVRKAILNGIDVSLYNQRNQTTDNDQYQINTYTPKGFVKDEQSKDYVEYYYEVYAEEKGLESSTQAQEYIGPQKVSQVTTTSTGETVGVNYVSGTDEADKLFEDARGAVQAAQGQIGLTLPVDISYLSVSQTNSQYIEYEHETVSTLGERMNGCTINSSRVSEDMPLCPTDSSGEVNYPYFNIIEKAPTSSTEFTEVAEGGYYTIYTGWGWIGDYADPLTYLHTYVTNGEMSAMCGNNDYNLVNYHYTDGVLVQDEKAMFEEYNDMVNAADDITTSNSARYRAFAEAEYYLINELNIMKPSQMSSQGWSASVSRAAGYEMPTSNYGLAGNIIKGMWVLVDVPSADERREARALQDQKEAEALAAVGNDTIAPAFQN